MPTRREISHLYLIVGLNELLKAHLLLQVEAKFFQATEDAVMIRRLYALVLPAAICGAAGFIYELQQGQSFSKCLKLSFSICHVRSEAN